MIRVYHVLHTFWMLNLLEDNITELFDLVIKSKSLIITIGNTYRSDDGIGPYIFDNLNNIPGNIDCINAGDNPENVIDEAVKINPDITLIIDAANFGGVPGEIRIIPSEFIPETTLSTHTFPPKIIAKILEEDTKSKIYFLGIQPASFDFNEGLSGEVKKTAEKIIDYFNNSIS